MALAAELLLSGMPKPLSRDGMCEMCKKSVRRYKCPGCSVKTCSVECCKLHKVKLGCDGRRDETAFKLLSQFDDNALLNDYLFLEKASRLVNSSRRGFNKFRLDIRSEWVAKLAKACSRRCIALRLVAPNMSRGYRNKTCFIPKRDVIMWQIEWIFPSINRKYIQNSRVPDALFSLISTNHAAAAVVRQYKCCYSSVRPQDQHTDESSIEEKSPEPECSLTFLLRLKPNRHCFDRWRLIDKTKTLAANLRLQCIVEHPTIVVLLPNDSLEPYLCQNGRMPSWMAKAAAATKQADDIRAGKDLPVANDKEDGEISGSVTDSDDISDTSVEEGDEAASSQKTSACTKMAMPLVDYGSDSYGESDCERMSESGNA